MSRLSIGQKCERSVRFLSALTKPEVASALVRIGFTDSDREEGYRRIAQVTAGKLARVRPAGTDPQVLARLDAWENRWYPTAEATLRHRFPAMHAHVFANLRQTEGPAVIVSVGTMVERLDSAVAEGVAGASDALALLARRGLDEATLAVARGILAELRVAPAIREPDPVSEEEMQAREAAMWSWYLEWSAIARSAIRQRGILRALGFLGVAGEDEEEEVPAVAPEESTSTSR